MATAIDTQIKDILSGKFASFAIESSTDDDSKETTITAREGWTRGFEIKVKPEEPEVALEFDSKIGTISNFGALGLTGILTYLFGWEILAALGLVADTGDAGVTLKIMFIIPVVIFLIPSFLLTSFITKRVSPVDTDLLERVQAALAEQDIKAVVE